MPNFYCHHEVLRAAISRGGRAGDGAGSSDRRGGRVCEAGESVSACRAQLDSFDSQLEYDNIEGMILLSELSRRRIRSIQKLIRVGRNEVVVVLRVDKEKGMCLPAHHSLSPLIDFPG